MSSRSPALALGLLVVGITGCELVFGLDDYARDPGGAGGAATTSATGGAGGAGDGGAASTSTSTSATSTGGEAGAASTSTGSGSCPCVPEGWTLTAAYPLGATPGEPRVCSNNVTADRARENPTVACTCSCGRKPETDCSLVCWDQPGCTDEARVLGDTGVDCTPLAPLVRSCAIAVVQGGAPLDEVCLLEEEAVVDASNDFDLCGGAVPGAACGDVGVCDPPPPDALWCVRGPAGLECPAGWSDDRDVLVGGAPDCACDCVDAVTCDAGGFDGFLVARGGNCFDQATDIGSRACTDTGDAVRYVGNAPGIEGDCVAQQDTLAGALVGTEAERLCCRP